MAAENLPHAVVSTGALSQPLPGGRSRYTVNGVPILELRDDVAGKVAGAQRSLLAPDEETRLLVGEVALLHTAAPQAPGAAADVVTFHIGGETLDEAAKSCVGAFEGAYSYGPPTWVASSNPDLAEVIAEHYGCPVRGMDEDLMP